MTKEELLINTIRLKFLEEFTLKQDSEKSGQAFDGREAGAWLEDKLVELGVEKVCGGEITAHLRKKLHHLSGISKFSHYF